VIAAAERTWQLYNDAILDPTSDERLTAAQSAMTGEALATATDIVLGFRADNQRAVESRVVPVSIDIDDDSVVLSATRDSSTVEFCRVGSFVLVETAGNPDNTDRVLDDTVNAYRERETYVRAAEGWLNSRVEVLKKFEGSTACVER
jgi:hypothetical protein